MAALKYLKCGEMEVSCIGFGARSFGSARQSPAAWHETLDFALDHGINLIDTAPHYQQGQSEELLGRLLKGRRKRVLLSTKVGTHGANMTLTPDCIRGTARESLRRLQTDYIDILFVHYPDPRADYGAIARTLQELKQEGLIRRYGLSNFDNRELKRWPMDDPPIFLQLPYSLLQQSLYNDVEDFVARQGITPAVYTPLAMGLLALPLDQIASASGYPQMLYAQLSPRGKDGLARLHRVAADSSTSPAALAIAWSLREGKNIALAGMRKREHALQALEGLKIFEDSFIRDLPTIEQPVLPMEGTVTQVLKEGSGSETLVLVKLDGLDAEGPLWMDGPIRAGIRLTLDGLTGKPIRQNNAAN